jgi:ankyrin repeat protein
MHPVIEACQNKDLNQLQLLFDGFIDSEPCLKTCIIYNFPQGVHFVLNNIPKYYRTVHRGDTHLPYFHMRYMRKAVKYDRIECVQVFLDHGCDSNFDTYPPIFALRSIKMAQLLLKYGTNINIVSDIQQKVECSLFAILCTRLLSNYNNGSTIYSVSESGDLVLNSDAQLILFLMEQGLKPHRPMIVRDYLSESLIQYNFKSLLFFVDQLHFDINILDSDGENLLFDAILAGNVKGVRLLLERGIQISFNNTGQTPLEYARSQEERPSINEIVKLIELYIEEPIKDPGND